MDISSVNRTMNVAVAAISEIPPEKAAENRSVVQAVKTLNGAEMFGRDNLLMFQRDPESKRMVIQVINQKTHEVVSQIPPEYLLRLAEDVKPQEADAGPVRAG